jgi:hypothetical protein
MSLSYGHTHDCLFCFLTSSCVFLSSFADDTTTTTTSTTSTSSSSITTSSSSTATRDEVEAAEDDSSYDEDADDAEEYDADDAEDGDTNANNDASSAAPNDDDVDEEAPPATSNNVDGLVSTCQETLPDADRMSPVALQRIAVEYQMILANAAATAQDAMALLDPIAERLHAALLRDLMSCQYNNDDNNDAADLSTDGDDMPVAQFHALYSAPPDVLKTDPETGDLARCDDDDATAATTNDVACFVASAQFSMEVFYHASQQRRRHGRLRFLQEDDPQQREQMQVATTLTDSALVTRLGTYLVEIFNGDALLLGGDADADEDQSSSLLARLQFNGFENVALDGSGGGPATTNTMGETRGGDGTGDLASDGGDGPKGTASAIASDYQEPRGNEPQVVMSSLAVIAAAIALILVAFLAIRRRRRRRAMRREETAVKSYYNQRLALERELAAQQHEEYYEDRHVVVEHGSDDQGFYENDMDNNENNNNNIVASALERDCDDIQNLLNDTTIVVMSDSKSSSHNKGGAAASKSFDDRTYVVDDDEPEEDGFEVDPRWRPDDDAAHLEAPKTGTAPSKSPNRGRSPCKF